MCLSDISFLELFAAPFLLKFEFSIFHMNSMKSGVISKSTIWWVMHKWKSTSNLFCRILFLSFAIAVHGSHSWWYNCKFKHRIILCLMHVNTSVFFFFLSHNRGTCMWDAALIYLLVTQCPLCSMFNCLLLVCLIDCPKLFLNLWRNIIIISPLLTKIQLQSWEIFFPMQGYILALQVGSIVLHIGMWMIGF